LATFKEHKLMPAEDFVKGDWKPHTSVLADVAKMLDAQEVKERVKTSWSTMVCHRSAGALPAPMIANHCVPSPLCRRASCQVRAAPTQPGLQSLFCSPWYAALILTMTYPSVVTPPWDSLGLLDAESDPILKTFFHAKRDILHPRPYY
jgi:hypothetical protein